MRYKVLIVCVTLMLTGCAVGPDYKRPDVPAPPQFRAGEPQPSQTSLGDVKWFDLFQDEILRGLIKEALQANYDIRIAAQRVLDAEGQLMATRSRLYPQVDGQAGVGRTRRQLPPPVGRSDSSHWLRGRSICSANCGVLPRPRAPTSSQSRRTRKP